MVVDSHSYLDVMGYRPAGNFPPIDCEDSSWHCLFLCWNMIGFCVCSIDEVL